MKKIKVWTKQNIKVLESLQADGRHTAKKEYLMKDENSSLVLSAYNWLMQYHPDKLNRPSDADYPVWVSFEKASQTTLSPDTVLLELEIDETLITKLNVSKWTDMTNLFYLPADKEDEERHKKMLDRYGINDPDAYMSPFYPMIKKEIEKSWSRLFDDTIETDSKYCYGLIWEIRSEWVKHVERYQEDERKIILYTAQADPVLKAIERDGTCFSKEEFVRKKYEDCSNIFLTAYKWYAKEAKKVVPLPEGAQLPYWAFEKEYNMFVADGLTVMKLEVPVNQVVLFDMDVWTKILRLEYVGNEQEKKAFAKELKKYNVSAIDAVLGNFYPVLKRKIMESWKVLFENDEKLKEGNPDGIRNVQAGLWQIKKEWIVDKKG